MLPSISMQLLSALVFLIMVYSNTHAVEGVFHMKHKSRLKPVELSHKSYSLEEAGVQSTGLDEDGMEMFNDPNSRLLSFIKKRARAYRRPVLHANDCVEVHMRASLYQIVDLDQRNNLATLTAYFDVWWNDPFIAWNASQFSGITKQFVPFRWLWRPEFYFYHSIQGRVPDLAPDMSAEVHADGQVRSFLPITARALCPLNLKYAPFDTQNCSFFVGSWSYQTDYVRLIADERDVFLGDFYDNQEWLLVDATVDNGTLTYLENETFSMIHLNIIIRRQSFYYVFNLVFPTTAVGLVAVVGFHAPINATGRRESKFRLGIMTLLSLSVMLLMLVDEMKFAFESIPGQRGSFSEVPVIGIYYMSLIFLISVATCTTSIFVHLEKYALRNQHFTAIPWVLRFLAAKKLFCCYVPRGLSFNKGDETRRNKNIQMRSNHSSLDSAAFRTLIPTQLNFTEYQQNAQDQIIAETSLTVTQPPIPPQENQKLDLLISLMREFLQVKREVRSFHTLPVYWERVIKRLESISLCFYISLITLNLLMFLFPELWY